MKKLSESRQHFQACGKNRIDILNNNKIIHAGFGVFK